MHWFFSLISSFKNSIEKEPARSRRMLAASAAKASADGILTLCIWGCLVVGSDFMCEVNAVELL